MSTRHLVVMAAGTGGHVIPGLAVAAEMQRRGWTVSWLGTEAGMENKLVPPSGLPMDRLSFAGLRGKGLKHSLLGVVRLFKALGQSAHVFSARKADAVLGMGGYVCFPGGLMAWVMRRPLMLVNADAALLLSNKALAPVAKKIAFGFDGLAAAQQKKSVVTGNPVRVEKVAEPTNVFEFSCHSLHIRTYVRSNVRTYVRTYVKRESKFENFEKPFIFQTRLCSPRNFERNPPVNASWQQLFNNFSDL